MRALIVACALLATLPATAQVNKCTVGGQVVYQQEACEPGQGVEIIAAKAPPLPVADREGVKLCRQAVPYWFKDPESVKIGPIAEIQVNPYERGNLFNAPRGYAMLINARNSYGGYTGEKSYRCYLNADETEVMQIVGRE